MRALRKTVSLCAVHRGRQWLEDGAVDNMAKRHGNFNQWTAHVGAMLGSTSFHRGMVEDFWVRRGDDAANCILALVICPLLCTPIPYC